ncbi:MAG TPA: high-potential iron-sulfur protein [Steroidobacteraceae bacterium]|jgi:hypothetical protein|nr:high-potential iron-sulfur protein [Steroidobacteraceae bacterium]
MNRPRHDGGIINRRTVVKNLAAVAAAAAVLSSRQSQSAELPHLDVKDPAAVKLGYVEDASQADAKKYPAFVKGSSCDNCLLLQGSPGADYRPCELFPGKAVSVRGWCSGWSAEI